MPIEAEVLQELTKINAKLEGINDKYELLATQSRDANAHTQQKIEGIYQLLRNDNDPSKGILIRLDRLEQEASRREWRVRVALTAAVAALFGVAKEWLLK